MCIRVMKVFFVEITKKMNLRKNKNSMRIEWEMKVKMKLIKNINMGNVHEMKINMVYMLIHEKPQELSSHRKIPVELLQQVGVVHLNLFFP